MNARAVMIAAPSSGAGKTTLSLALMRLLKRRGYSVSGYKTGPDFIDPSYHRVALSGQQAALDFPALLQQANFNLDAWAMPQAQLLSLFYGQEPQPDWRVVEGVMGLYDASMSGQGSSAQLAQQLQIPVILLLDCAKQGQSIAALAKGFIDYAPQGLQFAGLILNRVGSSKHEQILRGALEPLGLPILACLPSAPQLALSSRHLGLHQAYEHAQLEAFLEQAADWLEAGLEWALLEQRCKGLAAFSSSRLSALPLLIKDPSVRRIALAYDAAFSFIYPHHLAALKAQGITVCSFSPLANQSVPDDCDMVYLPGGYPELYAKQLAGATQSWQSLNACAQKGAWIWGECGGYMALGQQLIDAQQRSWPMAGLLDHSTSFAQPKRTLGYRQMQTCVATPFGARAVQLCGHEFHYSQMLSQSPNTEASPQHQPLFLVQDASGQALPHAGSAKGRVQGSYMHLL